MAGYITFWSKEHIKTLQKANDTGPLSVIYGSHHSKMPSIKSIKEGDVVYPVALLQGTLCVMARLPVEKIVNAFDYLTTNTGHTYGALIPEDVAIRGKKANGDIYYTCANAKFYNHQDELPDTITTILSEDEQKEIPHKKHQEPQTCCAEIAAVSMRGSKIIARPLPKDCLKDLRFGPTKSTQKPLRLNKDGMPTVVSLSGFVRKMSEDTQAIFEKIFDGE